MTVEQVMSEISRRLNEVEQGRVEGIINRDRVFPKLKLALQCRSYGAIIAYGYPPKPIVPDYKLEAIKLTVAWCDDVEKIYKIECRWDTIYDEEEIDEFRIVDLPNLVTWWILAELPDPLAVALSRKVDQELRGQLRHLQLPPTVKVLMINDLGANWAIVKSITGDSVCTTTWLATRYFYLECTHPNSDRMPPWEILAEHGFSPSDIREILEGNPRKEEIEAWVAAACLT